MATFMGACPCTGEEQFPLLLFFGALPVLKTLHSVKYILNEEECRSVGEGGLWWGDELAVVMAVKPPGAVQETLDVLEESKEDALCVNTAKRVKMLLELYEETLVTEDDVKRMKGVGGFLGDRVVLVQCTKPPDVVTRTCKMLDQHGYNASARQLRALNELFTRDLTAEELSEMARKGRRWEYVLSTKPAEVVQEACQVLEKHGCPVKELKILNELFISHLLTAEVVSEVASKGTEWEDHLTQVLLTEPAVVVQEACQVLKKHDRLLEKELRTLNELFTRHLLTAEESFEVVRKGREWEDHLTKVLATKLAEVVQESCQVLEKHGCSVKELKILNELFTRHLLTAEVVSEVASKGTEWEDHLTQVLLTKPAEVVQEACQVLEKHGCSVKELKILYELFTRHLLTAEVVSVMARKERRREYHLSQVLLTKPAEVVQEACQVLKKHGRPVKELRTLNELFTRHLLTAGESFEVVRKGREWEDHLTKVLATKLAEVVQESCQVLEKHGCSVKELKILNELFTRHLLTAEVVSEVASKGTEWEDHLTEVLLTKPAEVVQEACQVLEKHGRPVKQLKILNELFTRHLLTAEVVSEMARKERRWEYHLSQVLLTKPAEVVQEACQVLEKHGRPVRKELGLLSELYKETLVTEDEVKRMKGEGRCLSDRVVLVHCTKPPDVVTRTASVLDKYGHNEEARRLRALNELFTTHLLTAEEFADVARKEMWYDHLVLVLLTKPAEVVQEACQALKKHGCRVKKELKRMSGGPGSTQTHGLPDDTFTSSEYSTDSEDSLSLTKLSSDDEEDIKDQGSKVPSEPAGGESDRHEEPKPVTVKGFTEGDCSTLYHKAIRDNPTIALHVSKAMTIGPPRAGKTALRHHLLELEPPEVSSSTPVMKTAETVSVCPFGSAALPGEAGHVPHSGADPSSGNSMESDDASSSDESDDSVTQKVVKKSRYENRMFLVTKNKWVLVNNDSGILSLLIHLRNAIAARSSTAQKDRNRTKQKPVDYEIAAEANILPSIDETETEDIMLPSAHEGMHHEAPTQPSHDKSDSVALMSSRIYRELQNPDLADVALSDAHLLQFLDCGGQLAYHDILPLFVTIPAIYLNVFKVTEELTEYPVDELCSTEGNKMYAAKSALSIAEMVTRSVMTVRSLADRKVLLLPDVTCESKPCVMLVGTHYDKLDEKDANAKLKAAHDILVHAVQSPYCDLERVVIPNEKSQLMFFPVNNKLYVDKSHQSYKRCKCKHCRATKNLKERITKQAMEESVRVEIPVRWYLHQLLELSQSEEPFYSYSELYERCQTEGSVSNVGEFHAMVTYFHALGLLIHLCGADVGHTEESACLVFTNPSHLFENISKLYRVQFEDVMGGDKILLKRKGKLTRDALRELGVQLNPDHFMDLLVQLFIGAEIKSQKGDRILFIPSVLTSSPDDAAPSGVSTGPQEESLGFAMTFENTSFVPCGVFTGMSARLENAKGWEIFTKSISRKRMTFTVGTEGTITLFDHATHISVGMDCHEGQHREYRDTVIEAVADSYCFLFHSKSTKDPRSGPCSECVKSPYLVLGQTCQECHTQIDTPEAPHFAELKVDRVAKTVRCSRITTAKKLSQSECDLFQNMSHYAVIGRQHTGCTLEGAGSEGIPHSQSATEFSVSECLKKHETIFFEVVDPRLSLLRLIRKGVITEDVKSKIETSNTKDAREVLYHHLAHHVNVDTLKEYCEVAIDAEGYPKMQSLGRKMMEELVQGAASSLVNMVLEKYEEDFFKFVNAKLQLRKLIRRGVITDTIKGDIKSANDDEAREILFDHLNHNADVDTLKKYLKVAIAADGFPKMQSLGRKMMEELEQGGTQTH